MNGKNHTFKCNSVVSSKAVQIRMPVRVSSKASRIAMMVHQPYDIEVVS
jgi:hypothetical protein